MNKLNPNDYDCERPTRIECPWSDYTRGGHLWVDAVPHKREGWMLCELTDTCSQADRCEWAGLP